MVRLEISRRQRWICGGAVIAVFIAQAKWPNIGIVVNCLLILFFAGLLFALYLPSWKKRRHPVSVDSSDTK